MEHSREDGELLDTSITPTVDIVEHEIPAKGEKGLGHRVWIEFNYEVRIVLSETGEM